MIERMRSSPVLVSAPEWGRHLAAALAVCCSLSCNSGGNGTGGTPVGVEAGPDSHGSSGLGPGCLGSQGASCSSSPGEVVICPGPPTVCVPCGPGIFTLSESFCRCTSSTWDCAPPAAGEVQCSSPVGQYVDPACTISYGGDGGGNAPDGAPDLSDSDAAQPTPDAYVAAYVGPGTGSTSVCGYASDQTFVQIGSTVQPKPSTVTSGDFEQGAGTVTLDCKVDPSGGGGGFNIQLSAEVGGPNGGSLTVVGNVDVSGGTGIQGGFTSAANGSFTGSNCSVTFTYNGNPVPVGGSPVAAGRIWGHIDCPNAIEAGTVEIDADGGTTVRTCDAQADFLFENCD